MLSAVTNHHPAASPRPLLDVPLRIVHEPTPEWNYAHHPFLTVFRGRFFLAYSLGTHQEDDVGQKVMLTWSDDFISWAPPREVLAPEDPALGVLIPAGMYASPDRLNLYALRFEYLPGVLRGGRRQSGSRGRVNWGFRCLTSTDGVRFQEVPGPEAFGGNMPVRRLPSGRLFSCGGRTSAWTDDPRGLEGWHAVSLFPEGWKSPEEEEEDHVLLPGEVSDRHVDLCEGSLLALPDGRLMILLRSGTPWLFASFSTDGGETWSEPRRTAFTDNRTKFFLDRLSDGRYYALGTPDPFPPRTRHVLGLSLSRDGMDYDRHFLVCARQFKGRYPGLDKNGIYGYPTAVEKDGALYITCSLCKEMIAVLSLDLSCLGEP